MTAGIAGTGLYGQERALANELRADRQHLANAPLSARAKRGLERKIKQLEAELKSVRQQIRKSKA